MALGQDILKGGVGYVSIGCVFFFYFFFLFFFFFSFFSGGGCG